MSLRSQLIGLYNAQRIKEASQLEKAPLLRPTAAQRHKTAVRAGIQGGTARMAMAAARKLLGRAMMNILTLRQCCNLVQRFRYGATMHDLAVKYKVPIKQVENIVRYALSNQVNS
jgi:hypothetical protein